MLLEMTQFDSIDREFSRRRSECERLTEKRLAEVYSTHPEIRAIDDEIASISAEEAVGRLLGNSKMSPEEYRNKISALSFEKKTLLSKAGYPDDYLDPIHRCPLCGDTGYVDGHRCSCYNKALADLLYENSGLKSVLEQENFDTLSMRYHSPGFIDEKTGTSARAAYENAVNTAHTFVDRFGESYNNLLLYGKTGTGKSFLSNCIAKALMDKGYSVIYSGANDFFDRLAREKFSGGGSRPFGRLVKDCDLLIIDDLGSEMTNSFVSSELFALLNERALARKSIIISTNLEFGDIATVYSERTFSRILSNFALVKLIGDDIRVQKQYDNNKENI